MSSSYPSPTPSPSADREWTFVQNHQLLHLRDEDKRPWAEIASIMNRSTRSCSGHYYKLIQAHEGSLVDWTTPLDLHLLDGRRRGLVMKDIAAEMELSTQAVQDRWYTLVARNQVPEDVLAVWRRKEEVVWSAAEDETLLGLWMKGLSDEDIANAIKFRNKSKEDMRARRIALVKGSSPLYLKMLGLVNSKDTVATGLEKALGKKKYGWM